MWGPLLALTSPAGQRVGHRHSCGWEPRLEANGAAAAADATADAARPLHTHPPLPPPPTSQQRAAGGWGQLHGGQASGDRGRTGVVGASPGWGGTRAEAGWDATATVRREPREPAGCQEGEVCECLWPWCVGPKGVECGACGLAGLHHMICVPGTGGVVICLCMAHCVSLCVCVSVCVFSSVSLWCGLCVCLVSPSLPLMGPWAPIKGHARAGPQGHCPWGPPPFLAWFAPWPCHSSAMQRQPQFPAPNSRPGVAEGGQRLLSQSGPSPKPGPKGTGGWQVPPHPGSSGARPPATPSGDGGQQALPAPACPLPNPPWTHLLAGSLLGLRPP